jgi:hypothetical protein
MRKLSLNRPPFDTVRTTPELAWIFEQFKEIERASAENDAGEIADAFTIENHTPTYSLDVATATATDVANVLATFLTALKRRGIKRKA